MAEKTSILRPLEVMKQRGVKESTASPEHGHALNVVVVHQDVLDQARAMGLWDRVTRLVGADAVRSASWSVHELSDPAILRQATSAAIHAEVIVVSVPAAGELSPDLCAWIDAWLTQRRRGGGALMALVGISSQPVFPSDKVQEHLRAVARRARMDFLLQEYPAQTPATLPQLPEQAGKRERP